MRRPMKEGSGETRRVQSVVVNSSGGRLLWRSRARRGPLGSKLMTLRRRQPTRSHRNGDVTATQARAAVMVPAHIKNIRMEEPVPASKLRVAIPMRRRMVRGAAPNLGALGLTVWKALKDIVAGYILQIRQNGSLVHVGVWNWA